MDYGEVLTKAWKIIWKYKILWLFGIFASCSSGGGGGSSGVQYSDGDVPYGYYNNINYIEPWAIALIIAAVVLLVILIAVIVLAVSTVGRIGLVQGTQLADADEDAQVTFGGLFSSMKPYFWRVLGLNLLIGLGFFVIFMAIIFFIIFGSIITFGIGLLCLGPLGFLLLCLLIPVSWVLTTFIEMANVAIIVEDLGVIDGLKRGWEVFRGNLGEMVLMGLILVFGGMIAGLIIAMPMILTMIPLMMGVIAAAMGDTAALAAGGVIISGICCLAYLPVLIVVSGIIRAYISSAWTLTFLRLTQGPADEAARLPTAELLPDEPVEPEVLPEAAAASEELDTTEDSSATDEGENLLPDDF